MSYEEKDTCHGWRVGAEMPPVCRVCGGGYMHMRRRIHEDTCHGCCCHQCVVSVEEDTCHMRRRLQVAYIQYPIVLNASTQRV
jgi:hypothetical protein